MVNSPNNNNNTNGIMEIYDDRPISMYDNLNNMTTNMNTTTAMNSNNTSTPKVTKIPASTTETTTTPTSSKTNGAAHSTPFADITFKFNENKNMQQQQINGNNRNLNQNLPNTGNNAAVYATPYKTATKPVVINTASPIRIQTTAQQQPPPPQQPINALTSSSLIHTTNPIITATALTATTTTPTAALHSDTFNSYNGRPLSQHSQSELNETSHSIAAVKAALNEAKSKFFGLNGYAPQQQQQDYEDDDDDDNGQSHNNNLLPSLAPKIQQVQITKPQPKYQNIPENSAIFRNQTGGIDSSVNGGDGGGGSVSAPELPPKPVEYQSNFYKQPTTKNNNTTTPDNMRKMPVATSYNQISLNDIVDSAASRSQTVYMATTVPQNIKGNKIAGRHTPTRTSLRHSRMLVVNNKNYEEIQHPNPMGFQQPNLARWLLILQIIIGILLLSLSIWIVFLTPNAPIQDNPYWCGLVLLITGIIGLIVIRYRRIKRAKTREHCFMFLRMDSHVLSLLSVLLCCVALIFAAIHYCRLTAPDTKCKSMNLLLEHGSCVCTFNVPLIASVNTTEPLFNAPAEDDELAEDIKNNSYNVEYRDLSCQEVTGPWTSILGLSFILNSLGFLISFTYIVLLACCRKSSKRFYTTVHTSTF